LDNFNRAFHGFREAKFAYGGSVFRLEPIFTTAPAASKNDAQFKKWSKSIQNNHRASCIDHIFASNIAPVSKIC